MLSPNPKIMERVQKETEYMEENKEACERLVKKLIVPNHLIGRERLEVSSIDKFEFSSLFINFNLLSCCH